MELSDRAVPLPLLERDPAENGVDAGRWPAWRGKNGSGIAPGGSPAVEFSDTEGFRWKVAVPGAGNSSPVVWDDCVLLTSAIGQRDPPTLAVLCFDRTDGKLRWRKEAGKAKGRTHNKNGYASASVATDGQRIFAFFGSTGLFCYDFSSGEQLWRADLGNLDHQWGTAASPVLYGQLVIQVCDCEKGSYVAAFDQSTGKQVWRTPRPSCGCWSTPVFVDVETADGRRTEMIVNGTGAWDSDEQLIIAYDPGDGRQLWRVRGLTQWVTPTPVQSGGLVYCVSGRNGPISAIRPGGSGDVTDTRVVWRWRRGGPYIPSGVAYRNRLFVVTDDGRLSCYNAGNGEQIWQGKLRGHFSASLIAADGRIYAVDERGTVSVCAAADSFELLAQNKLGERCLATPAVADGDLLIRTESKLYCIPGSPQSPAPSAVARQGDWPLFRGDSRATGVARSTLPEKLKRLWTFSVDEGRFEGTAAIADGTVYVGCTDGKLYAIDLASGRRQWEFSTELGFTASPAVRNGRVYIGDADGRFYCIDARSGRKKWDFMTEAEINSSANFYQENVLFGSQDGTLYCLDAGTGRVVWKYQSEDMIQCSPAVAGDRGFVAGCDGRLHVIDLDEGKLLRSVDIEAPTLCTPAILGRVAFVGTTGNTFFAVDWQKAEVLWRYENPERSAEFRSSAAVTPKVAVVGSRDKLVHAIDTGSGRPLWTFATKARVDGSPVVVGNRVFVGSADGRLYALELDSGRKLWQFDAGGSILASPAVAAGRLVIGTDEGDLYCFGAKEM